MKNHVPWQYSKEDIVHYAPTASLHQVRPIDNALLQAQLPPPKIGHCFKYFCTTYPGAAALINILYGCGGLIVVRIFQLFFLLPFINISFAHTATDLPLKKGQLRVEKGGVLAHLARSLPFQRKKPIHSLPPRFSFLVQVQNLLNGDNCVQRPGCWKKKNYQFLMLI